MSIFQKVKGFLMSETKVQYPPHVLRVIEEKKLLDILIISLSKYTTEGCKGASEKEGILLNKQLIVMKEYSDILEERISLYK